MEMRQKEKLNIPPAIAVIGGSGFYQMDGFEQSEERAIDTPFGKPSDTFRGGKVAGKQVWFLPRHGRYHSLLPHEINHRANFWALKSLGVRWVICVTAVGSLKIDYAPRDILLPDQFFDRTSQRSEHTFFGRGIAAHVAFGQPLCAYLRGLLCDVAVAEGAKVHDGGTYVNMDGPAFSTKAESEANRKLGFDVIGMTNLAEAKLAREAEMSLATLSMITDYDCWNDDEDDVTVDAVIHHLNANSAMAKKIVLKAIQELEIDTQCPEHVALDQAIITPKAAWPQETCERLAPILARFF
jgi:5'-methylthioadenosine phosphorylase